MKKLLTFVLVMIVGVFILCSCGEKIETVTDQTMNLRYEIAEGWTAKSVSPAPSQCKIYEYGDYSVKVEFLSYKYHEDPLQESLDEAIGDTLAACCPGASYEQNVPEQGNTGEFPSREVRIESDDIDGEFTFSGIFTSLKTEDGIYLITSITEAEELTEPVKDAHQALKQTVEYADSRDREDYTKNIFQFPGYLCAVPAWDEFSLDMPLWSLRTEYENGIIHYVSGMDISSMTIVPMDDTELTDDIIVDTLNKIYNGSIGPEAAASIIDREMTEAATGSALVVRAGLSFGEQENAGAETSAMFLMDENGKAVACICNTSDADYDYSKVAVSVQDADQVYENMDSIYEKRIEYVGDNSAVSSMLNELGLGVYGDYTFELQTSEEPFGLTVNYDGNIDGYDFQREAVILIGLIENLDSVDIRDGSGGVVHYDYELVKSLMKYDVKKMAAEKPVFETYYLETLF